MSWQQTEQLVNWVICNTLQHIRQPCPGIDSLDFTWAHKGIHHGISPGALMRSGKKIVFPTQCQRADQVFDHIVVQFQPSVLQDCLQFRPLGLVIHRFAARPAQPGCSARSELPTPLSSWTLWKIFFVSYQQFSYFDSTKFAVLIFGVSPLRFLWISPFLGFYHLFNL